MRCLHTSSHLKQGWFSLFASLMSVMGCFVGGGSREHPDSHEKPWRALLPEPLRPSGQHGHGHHDGHDKGAGASVTFNPRHVIRNSRTCVSFFTCFQRSSSWRKQTWREEPRDSQTAALPQPRKTLPEESSRRAAAADPPPGRRRSRFMLSHRKCVRVQYQHLGLDTIDTA